MKRWWYGLLIRLRDSISSGTSEETVNKASDIIVSKLISDDLTIRQQTDTLFLAVKKLSDHRKAQIEETQTRLAVLQEDYAKLNK